MVLRFRQVGAAQPGKRGLEGGEAGGKAKRPATGVNAFNAERYNRVTDETHGMSTQQVMRAREEGVAIQLKKFHNSVKRELINRFARNAGMLLDLASGRGGDLNKWIDAGVGFVQGLDIAETEVAEATRRFEEMKAVGRTRQLKAAFNATASVGQAELPLKDGIFDVHHSYRRSKPVAPLCSALTRGLVASAGRDLHVCLPLLLRLAEDARPGAVWPLAKESWLCLQVGLCYMENIKGKIETRRKMNPSSMARCWRM